MMHRRAQRILLAGGIIVSLAALVMPPLPARAVTRPVPGSLRVLCASAHFSCQGRWVHIGGKTVYELSTPVAITARGGIRPLVTGCNPSDNYNYCTVSNVGGGKCWSDNSQSGNGVKVVLNNCDPNSQGQSWVALSSLDGTGFTWAVANNLECLNDPGGTNAAGTQMQIWDCYVTKYEDFGFEFVGPGSSQVLLAVDSENPGSGSSSCLSDNGNSNSGAPLVIEPCNGGSNQRWYWPHTYP